ncbi:fatty acyl-CoA synthetase [Rhodococcus sp. IEGM 1408]|uniref:fatty acyl-CoA synthetase n=1 Tax=Rhodococcus sp. IEGM 1408 TaxID=3082220 RepID=UPI002954DF2F|nr:fatty acyl-CoA synthetase [Rhodococcus sp. IEGM 1408]MDV8002694.1 fatty acyl-CoA synthetase [Rhodococcus sp. IEGM 1408]
MTTTPQPLPSAVSSATIDAVLHRSASRFPGRVALTFAGRRWTYAELDSAVDRVAGMLASRGLESGARVAAYGVNSDAYLIAFLAVSRAGFTHVPVNYALTGPELEYLLTDSGASLVLVDPAQAPTLETVLESMPGLQTLALLPNAGESPDGTVLGTALDEAPCAPVESPASGGDLAQLLYTSGTTSRPKGAMMTHSALVHEYVSCILTLDLAADDEPLVTMPLYHSAAMHVFALPYLSLGATVHLMAAPDIQEILRRVEADKIGSLFLAPTVWVPLASHPDLETRDLSSLRKAQYGASIMPVTVLQRLRGKYPELGFYNCFGQSEIGPLACVLRPEEHDARPASAGRAVFFVEARVLDENGVEVADGERGEVVYRSPQLCAGYWNKPEATAEAFRDGWFHSGDLVIRDSEGFIEVVDRIKDVINTGGVLVASREVEDAVYQDERVAEVAVIGTPDEKWIEAVTAIVVLKDGTDATESEIIDGTRTHLAPFKVPKRVVFVDELPRNQSGKLLKRELRQG